MCVIILGWVKGDICLRIEVKLVDLYTPHMRFAASCLYMYSRLLCAGAADLMLWVPLDVAFDVFLGRIGWSPTKLAETPF